MLRVYGFVFCSISFLPVYKCVRIPLSSRSIVGVPSSRALPVFPPHHMCAFLIEGCVATKQQKKMETSVTQNNLTWPNWRFVTKTFESKYHYYFLRVSVFSLVIFLKSRVMSFDRKLYPIHESRYRDRDLLPQDCVAYCKSNNNERNGNMEVPGLFICSGGKKGKDYLKWRSRKKCLIP